MNHSSAGTSCKNWVLANVLVLTSYALVSWLFLIVAVPPGYSSPFWPGAGIALAAVLMCGPRLGVGVFLGSWLVNFFHVGVPHHDWSESLRLGAIATGVGTGALLQALLGRYLVLRFCERPLRLDRHGSVLKFLFVLTPLSSLISSSVGVSTLYWSQTIDSDTVLINWFTWWIGDAFGAAVFLPMILAFCGKPALLWRPRRLSLCLPAVCLIGVLLLLNSKTAEWQSASAQGLIKLQGQQLLNQLEHSLFQKLLILQSSHGDLRRYDNRDLEEFEALRTQLQNSSDALQSLTVFKGPLAGKFKVRYHWQQAPGPLELYRGLSEESRTKDQNQAEFFVTAADQLMAHVQVTSETMSGDTLQIGAVFDYSKELHRSSILLGLSDVRMRFAGDNDKGLVTDASGVSWIKALPRSADGLFIVLTLPYRAMMVHPQKEYFLALSFGLFLALTLFSILLVASGQSYRFEMLFRDRSQELKLQQLKAEHSAKMAALGSMAGSIAHEVNNPLAIIHGYAQFLLNKIDSGRTEREELRHGLSRIKETSQRISDIIKALRSYARDDRQDDLMDCSVPEIISETIHLCFELLKNKQISIAWNPEPNLGIRFRGRKAALMQALLNLINNPRDAIAGLDKKWIQIDLQTEDEQGTIQVRVTDSGSGIPAEIREKIMLPFFSTKANGVGTGLGLSISKNLVESMGGHLTLDESAPNTCFVLSLPRSLS